MRQRPASGQLRQEGARAHGRRVVAVLFDTSLQTCLARNAARARVVRESVIVAMHAAVPSPEQLHAEGFDAVHHPGTPSS